MGYANRNGRPPIVGIHTSGGLEIGLVDEIGVQKAFLDLTHKYDKRPMSVLPDNCPVEISERSQADILRNYSGGHFGRPFSRGSTVCNGTFRCKTIDRF